MTDIVDSYKAYLIKQYYEKPKANAHIELYLSEFQLIADASRNLVNWMDVDTTSDFWLDIIGNIVRLNRRVSNVLTKNYFGFDDNPNARGFGDLYNTGVLSAPFYDLNSAIYGEYELDTESYRKLLKVKIAKNNAAAFMDSDDRISIQDVIEDAFDGDAYVIDNQDMTLTLLVSPSVETEYLRLILELDLLPRPMTVYYGIIITAEPEKTFGFSDNPNAKGFGDLSDAELNENGGYFAEIFINE